MKNWCRSASVAFVVGAGVLAGWSGECSMAAEQGIGGSTDGVLSQQQIEQGLRPTPAHVSPTRGLARRPESGSAPAPDAGVPATSGVNLNIPFEYNSSSLKAEASAQLQQLQRALNSEALRSDRFLVAGHTDAKGSVDSNKRLSLRRAEAVRQYLVANGVDADRLSTIGYGSEHLLVADRPEDAQNRRVEIRDLGSSP